MSYQIKISPIRFATARIVSQMQAAIQEAFTKSGITQQELAKRIGVDRSIINRRLLSKANLTERSIAEIAYALNSDIEFQFVPRDEMAGRNWSCNIHTTSPVAGEHVESLEGGAKISSTFLKDGNPQIESVSQ